MPAYLHMYIRDCFGLPFSGFSLLLLSTSIFTVSLSFDRFSPDCMLFCSLCSVLSISLLFKFSVVLLPIYRHGPQFFHFTCMYHRVLPSLERSSRLERVSGRKYISLRGREEGGGREEEKGREGEEYERRGVRDGEEREREEERDLRKQEKKKRERNVKERK